MLKTQQRGRSRPAIRTLAAVGAGAVALYGSRLLLNFFGPVVPYKICRDLDVGLDSDEFLRFLSIVTNATVRGSHLTRLRDGEAFYPAEMAALREARRSINMEFYEFSPGRVADAMLQALCERARAGVEVRLIVDALGSFGTPRSYFEPLRAAGGRMYWYHPLRWNTWREANQRTHRKLITVDGEVGFLGGAGVADHWRYPTAKGPQWRDTVFRVEGAAVAGLLSTFAENWLECAGEILSGPAQFEFEARPGGAPGLVVSSTPHGGGTTARILFQALLKSARKSIQITTPYFLPDRSAKQALVQAVQQRGVRVQILTAGPEIDHPIVRRLSLHSSRYLLEGGAEIYDYQPAMIHAKLMTIDGQWSVLGSTNFDHRSFALNDEVNLAVLDRALAATLDADFQADLQQSKRLTLDEIARRTLVGRIARPLTHVLKLGS